jgi:hypothetical protein
MDTIDEIVLIGFRPVEGGMATLMEKMLADRRQQLTARLRTEMAKERSGSIADPLLTMLGGLRQPLQKTTASRRISTIKSASSFLKCLMVPENSSAAL